MPDDVVQTVEAWASKKYFTSLCSLSKNANKNEHVHSAHEASEIVKGFFTDSPRDEDRKRTRSYRQFSRSGYRSINFESKTDDPLVRADPEEISLTAYCCEMLPRHVIEERMLKRRACAKKIVDMAIAHGDKDVEESERIARSVKCETLWYDQIECRDPVPEDTNVEDIKNDLDFKRQMALYNVDVSTKGDEELKAFCLRRAREALNSPHCWGIVQ